MSKHRLWVDRLAAGTLVLDDERARYVSRVLRLGPGDTLTVLAGDGSIATATVASIAEHEVRLTVADLRREPPAALELTVALAAPKGERADWAVEKLTELGVTRVLFVHCERSVVVPKAHGQRAERWRRLAEAAAKQSGRARLPSIEGPRSFEEVLALEADHRFVADRGGAPLGGLMHGSGSVILLVGPEGGLTSAELVRASERGYIAGSLGPHILRIETAAVAGAAVLLSTGSWSGR